MTATVTPKIPAETSIEIVGALWTARRPEKIVPLLITAEFDKTAQKRPD